jgi:hypothetical protein
MARRGPALRTIDFRGYAARVPASWPVYDLARDPQTCVRFNRHAVYLGTPGQQQRCPAHAAGHTSALLLEPSGHSVRAITSAAQTRPASPPAGRARAAAASARARAASVYTGNGFDVCDTPSTQTMSDWSGSPYHAIGVYIGGVNAACSQGNLTSSWVATEVRAGWHLILIYVGLQAPNNSCGCSGITRSQASAQGAAAADDAIADAQSLGIPRGNPIYDDMESYPTGASNSSTVLSFLSAWTSELHAKGYISGVYSSASTGVSDLAAQYGNGYEEPDDLWIADWNGSKSTSDPYVPASDWSSHQRLHQYSGSHNETYGGATLNIDGDYVDGATAGTGAGASPSAPEPPKPPTLSVSSGPDGTTSVGVSWSGQGLVGWRILAGTGPSALSSAGGGAAHGGHGAFKLANDSPYFAVQALGPNSTVLATSPAVAAPAHIAAFGHSAFVSARGTGGLPAGCYTGQTCHLSTTITAAGAKIASTGTESILSGATGLVFFTLNATGRFMLANSPGGRLPVEVTLRETGGSTATIRLILIPFSTRGHGPRRSVDPASPVRILGATDFVPGYGMGGILASCASPVPCHIAAKLTSGRTTLATTGTEAVGAEQAGYVFFRLSPSARRLLMRAAGNQLRATVTLTDATAGDRASIALVRF